MIDPMMFATGIAIAGLSFGLGGIAAAIDARSKLRRIRDAREADFLGGRRVRERIMTMEAEIATLEADLAIWKPPRGNGGKFAARKETLKQA